MLFHRTIEFLLYPPGNLLLFLLLAWLLGKRARLAQAVLVLGIIQLLLFSMPAVSNRLMASLENDYPAQDSLWQKTKAGQLPQAIVVLGGGRNDAAWEYGGLSVSSAELERLRYAAFLQKQTGLPILVTGGDPLRDGNSEASLMKQVLESEFSATVDWMEEKSHTTWENAELSDKILHEAGITSAWLVTHAWHMPRSMQAFANRRVDYVAAPHSFGLNMYKKRWLKWIPQSSALMQSTISLHEYLGMLWYRLK